MFIIIEFLLLQFIVIEMICVKKNESLIFFSGRRTLCIKQVVIEFFSGT